MSAFRILTYHHIGRPRTGPKRKLTVLPDRFRLQVRLLRLVRFRFAGLDAVRRCLDRGEVGPWQLAMTFDDGFAEIYEHAVPLLIANRVPAVVYVICDRRRADWSHDWGPDGAPALLSWPQIREMADLGIAIGSHTRTHAKLRECSRRTLRDEIVTSKRIIEDRIGRPVKHFSYPHGIHNDLAVETVREAGYATACTIAKGVVRKTADPYRLPRLGIANGTGALRFLKRILFPATSADAGRRKGNR